jgi:hypothetical protein
MYPYRFCHSQIYFIHHFIKLFSSVSLIFVVNATFYFISFGWWAFPEPQNKKLPSWIENFGESVHIALVSLPQHWLKKCQFVGYGCYRR